MPGNEKADEQAKLASSGTRDSPRADLPEALRETLKWNKSAVEMATMRRLEARAAEILRSLKQPTKANS